MLETKIDLILWSLLHFNAFNFQENKYRLDLLMVKSELQLFLINRRSPIEILEESRNQNSPHRTRSKYVHRMVWKSYLEVGLNS